jgi:uncharacterized protein YgfB (UPF0149 family)
MTHPELEAALARVHVTIDASEAHGWLAGALCVRDGYGAAEWLAEMAEDSGGAAPAADPPLAGMPAETLAALRSDQFEFAPLLPDDEAPLPERVDALAAWAGGFLYGVGTGASEPAIAAAGDVGEFLRDLADIARVELEPGREDDAGEADFVELVEFVRAGAQLTFDDLAGARADAPG